MFIQEIKTNEGNFHKYEDIEKYMRQEKISVIKIYSVQLWIGSPLKLLEGTFSYSEILKTVTSK